MVAILTEMISIITGGLVSFAEGIAGGLNAMVTDLFVVVGEGGTYSLSVFGGVISIFAGLALAFGLSRWVTNLISRLGRH